ncbi:helix-turn-helix transcriptional regulator [Aureimonas pseudogalii]|uniref:DNA-binding CsgD family transcriptional regulator n=1 Tax=Aureimonas pseudogalii TaxID=1744844 RepID=A0A7W6EFE2_9HYPH|nr:helix-turn-helix transcriptional regulator [Aureimonas pseudogalii]MBB3997620.1 DNA-binding CsgD family transcriptional regulator [Aureimonas pseudogalii]
MTERPSTCESPLAEAHPAVAWAARPQALSDETPAQGGSDEADRHLPTRHVERRDARPAADAVGGPGGGLQWRARLEDVQAEIEALHQAFDALATAIVTATPRGMVRSVNQLASQILAARDGLQLEGEHLRASHAPDQRELDALLALAAEPPGTGPVQRPEIRLRRRSGAPPLIVSLTAVRRALASGPAIVSEATVVLKLERMSVAAVSPPDLMTQRFGLTRSESELVDLLLLGRSLREVARERGVSYETVRSHIKHVFSKTGTHRQIDLVNLARSLKP